MSPHPKRGDVYFVDFNPTRGSEQSGIRPAVVVSNNRINFASPVITVIPLTHSIPRKKFPQNVPLPPDVLDSMGGTILCAQIKSVSKERLRTFVGRLPSEVMLEVSVSLRKCLEI